MNSNSNYHHHEQLHNGPPWTTTHFHFQSTFHFIFHHHHHHHSSSTSKLVGFQLRSSFPTCSTIFMTTLGARKTVVCRCSCHAPRRSIKPPSTIIITTAPQLHHNSLCSLSFGGRSKCYHSWWWWQGWHYGSLVHKNAKIVASQLNVYSLESVDDISMYQFNARILQSKI